MRPRIRFIALASSALMLMAACASKAGLSDEEQALADAFAVSIADDEDGLGVPKADAQCMAEAMMAVLGSDPFDEAEVTPEDVEDAGEDSNPGALLGDGVVSDAQANSILDDWEGCVDLPVALAESAATEFDLEGDEADCLAEGFEDGDFIRNLMVFSFTKDDDTPSDETIGELLELVDSCGGEDGVSPLVAEIAAGMMEDSNLTEDEANCLAQALLDDVGAGRLAELGASGDFSGASNAEQQEIAEAIIAAAGACDVPISAFGG